MNSALTDLSGLLDLGDEYEILFMQGGATAQFATVPMNLMTENNKADYIIDNYINWHGKYKKKRYEIPSNFKISDEITVGKIRILTIYKKNN